MEAELTPKDKAILAELLRDTIAADRYPLSPCIRSLRAILAKLAPPRPIIERFPVPKPPGELSTAQRKKRGRR